MERRTDLNWVAGWLLIALGSLPAARASEVLNPDEAFPVSRFGASEFSGADREPASAPAEDEELRGRDRITHQQASPETGAATSRPQPLGTVRRAGVQEVAVIAGDLGFFPRTVFVTRDVPVRMFVTGASKNSLCMLMDSFSVRKQIKSQKIEEVSFTPNQPGRFRFYCPINGAEGFVVVREFERADGG